MVELIEQFPYKICFKRGKENVVADAFTKRYSLLSTLNAKLLSFEFLKELYSTDEDFGESFIACQRGVVRKLTLLDCFLVRDGEIVCAQDFL